MLSIRAISAVLCLYYIHSSSAHVLPVIDLTPHILTPLEYVLHNLAEQPEIIGADEYYDGSGDTIVYEVIDLEIFENSGEDSTEHSGDDEDNSTDTPAQDTTNALTTDMELTMDTTVPNILPNDESTTTHPVHAEINAEARKENVVRLMDNLELI